MSTASKKPAVAKPDKSEKVAEKNANFQKAGKEFAAWVGWWRESLVLPWIVCAIVAFIIVVVIPKLTGGREAMFDPNVLGDYAMRLVGICLIVALVGFLKGKSGMLPDVDEDGVKDWNHTPWQLVAVDAACTLIAICFLSWLVVR